MRTGWDFFSKSGSASFESTKFAWRGTKGAGGGFKFSQIGARITVVALRVELVKPLALYYNAS